MDDPSRTLFALFLAALWCGFALHGLARLAARSPQGRELLARLRRRGPLAQGVALVLSVIVVAFGGSKPSGGNGGGGGLLGSLARPPTPPPEPAFGLVEVRTEGVALRAEPTNAVEAAAWRLRGASEDGIWIECEKPFFALGTNPVRRVYASASGALSFGSARHPPIGAPLPDSAARSESSPHLETGLAQRLGGDASPHLEAALVPFRAPLGLLPAAAETNAAPSRFWHAPAPGGGLLVAWENVLVDRLPGRRATVQAELRPSGDFRFLYDFPDLLDPPATNFVIGAQAGTNAVNALAILGTNLLAETVWRVDGARATNGVSVADLLCTNGVLRTPARFALEWRNTSGLDPNADSDGDGLSDWDEVFVHGTDPRRADTDGDSLSDSVEVLAGANPLDADENNDGIPDGVDPVAWAADPIWADNAGKTNLVVTLGTAIPDGAAASLVLGSVTIPLRSARHYVFGIPSGVEVPFRLFSRGVAAVDLSMSNALPGQPARLLRSSPNRPQKEFNGPCLRLHDLLGVFDGKQTSGEGFVAEPRVYLRCESGDDDMLGSCIHGDGFCVYSIVTEPASCSFELHEADEIDGFQIQQGKFVSLHVTEEPGDSDYGYIRFGPKYHCWGDADIYHGIHRCEGGPLVWCAACGMYHAAYDEHACPHQSGCPSRTNALAACTCPVPVIRVDGTGTPLSEFAELDFPDEAYCCCSRPTCFTYARLIHIDSNLSIWDSVAPSNWVEAGQCPASATVYATGESGNAPSEIEYQLVRRHYDGNGSVVSNEVFGTRTLRVWAIDAILEPVTTTRIDNRIINPCGIILGETATFRIDVSPAAFPDSLIEWTATPSDRVQFVGNIRTGRQVSVTGYSQGDVTLTAHITGYSGPPPLVRARVMPRTTVPVYAWIVCGTNGVPAVGDSVLRGKFPEINRIWDQAGITWQLAEVNFVTNQDWLSVSPGDGGCYDSLCSHGQSPGGVELYCVTDTPDALGMTTLRGAVVKGTESATTYAHEFGHFCDLRDIYVSHSPETSLVVGGSADRSRLEYDWPSDSTEGYYPENLPQANLIRRLLMTGRAYPGQADLSAGDVYGLWNNRFINQTTHQWEANYELGDAPVGFLEHGDKQPVGN